MPVSASVSSKFPYSVLHSLLTPSCSLLTFWTHPPFHTFHQIYSTFKSFDYYFWQDSLPWSWSTGIELLQWASILFQLETEHGPLPTAIWNTIVSSDLCKVYLLECTYSYFIPPDLTSRTVLSAWSQCYITFNWSSTSILCFLNNTLSLLFQITCNHLFTDISIP